MELLMSNKPGGGVGQNAKNIETGKAISSYDDWNAAVKGCMQHKPKSYGGDDKQRALGQRCSGIYYREVGQGVLSRHILMDTKTHPTRVPK